MKRLSIVLAIAALMGLAQASQAANLQTGWFVKIYGVNIWTYTYPGPPAISGAAQFVIEPGQYGPFIVSDGGDELDRRRDVSVIADIVATPDQSLILPLYPFATSGDTSLEVWWATNYDSSQMQLEFWHRNSTNGALTLLGGHDGSGMRDGNDQISLYGLPPGDYFFKVRVVPEPSSIIGLVVALPMLVGFARRRK